MPVLNSVQKVLELRREVHEKAETVGLMFGCYDVLHEGHMAGIEYARQFANVIIVGLAPDTLVRAWKGSGRPINPLRKRLSAIAELPGVDFSFGLPVKQAAISAALLRIRPDVYAEYNEHYRHWKRLLPLFGIDYRVDNGEKLNSTTSIIKAATIASSDVWLY